MSNTEHTEGPWTLTHVSGSNFAVQRFEIRGVFFNRPNAAPIFNKDTSAIDGTTICCSPEDARLIAASPDLLDACRQLIAATSTNDDCEVGNAVTSARMAIAKATGEQS